MSAYWYREIPPVGGRGGANLRACLKMERGCVEDQPQHGENTPKPRSFAACCGWSRTTQPRSGIFRQALGTTPQACAAGCPRRESWVRRLTEWFDTATPGHSSNDGA